MKDINILCEEDLQIRSENIRFIDLRLDFAFRLVFGRKGNEGLLLRLVNAILPDLHAASVELSGENMSRLRRDARAAVFDIHCKTEAEEDIIIEMQYRHQDDFNDRLIFYSSFPIYNSLSSGTESFHFKPVYMIGISDFILPEVKRNEDVVNYYRIKNQKHGTALSERLTYVTVELPKLRKRLVDLKTEQDLLFYAIRHIGNMDEMPEQYSGSGLEKLFEMCSFAAMSIEEQETYFANLIKEIDSRSQLRTARNEGLSEGIAKGISEGREEARLEAAKKLKALGVKEDIICQATGLSAETVASL